MSFAIGNRVLRSIRFTLSTAAAGFILATVLAPTPILAEETQAEIPTKTVKMTVENFKWVPDQLRVPKGTKVVLQIRGYDATHRFDMKKPYNLKVLIPQGKSTTVEFVAHTVGTFRWKCGRPCGDGCPKMRGKLTVYDPVAPTGGEED